MGTRGIAAAISSEQWKKSEGIPPGSASAATLADAASAAELAGYIKK